MPLTHRYLGAPVCLREAEALAVLGPLLSSAEVRKHAHDAKLAEVLLLRRGIALAGRGVGFDDRVLPARRLAHPLRSGRRRGRRGPRRGSRAHRLDGHRPQRPPRERFVGRGGRHAPLRRGLRGAGAGRAAGAQADRRHLDRLYHDLELPLSHALARIETRGIRLDVDYLRALGNEVSTSLVALETEIHGLAGQAFNINSNKQLADMLFGKLSLPVIRKTKTGASTDADMLEELAALHPVPAKIVEYRALAKLKGTYIDALPALVDPATARLHTSFDQAVAATGRLSSSDPNLQNIPIRTEVGRRIRRAFVAEPGSA